MMSLGINLPALSKMNLSRTSPAQPQSSLPRHSAKTALPSIKINFGEKRIFIFVFLIILILSVTIFRQTIINIVKLRAENELEKNRLMVMTTKASYLQDLDQNQLGKRVRELEQVFPSKKPALELLNSLSSLAQEDGVQLSAVTLKPGKLVEESPAQETTKASTGGGQMQSFLLDFSVNGEVEKVNGFIKDLERTAPLTKIEDLTIAIQGSREKEQNLNLRLGLSVRVYYQSLPKTIPPIEAPIVHLTSEEEVILDQLSLFKFFPLETLPSVTMGKEDLFKK